MSKVSILSSYPTSKEQVVACDVPVIVNLEIGDESPPSSKFHMGNKNDNNKYYGTDATFNDNIDSGCGTGSDEECLISLQSSTEISSDPNSSPGSKILEVSDSFDFWNKTESKKSVTDSEEVVESGDSFSNGLSVELSSDYLSSDCKLTVAGDFGITLSDLLSIESPIANSFRNKNSENQEDFHNSNSFSQNNCSECDTYDSDRFDSDTNLCDLLIAGSSPKNKMVVSHSLQLEECELNKFTNVYSNFHENNPISNDSSPNVSLSDLLSSVHFDNDTAKHSVNEPDSSIHFGNSLTSSGVSLLSTGCKESICSSFNTELSLSDLLSSICFDDDNTDAVCSGTRQSADSKNSFRNENNSGDFSVGLLDSKHKPGLADNSLLSNLLETEEETEISLSALAKQHLSLSQPPAALPPVFNQTNGLAGLIEESNGFTLTLSRELKGSESELRMENENSEESLSMLDLLADVDINEESSADKILECQEEEESITSFNSLTSRVNALRSTEDDDCSLLDVDLTSCLKCEKPPNISLDKLSTSAKDRGSPVLEELNLSPFRFSPPLSMKEVCPVAPKARVVDVRQSLFAKALSCKPKRDPSAVLKILNLQNDICNHYFNPSQLTVTKPVKETIAQTNQCVIASLGRRIFGHGAPCEVL